MWHPPQSHTSQESTSRRLTATVLVTPIVVSVLTCWSLDKSLDHTWRDVRLAQIIPVITASGSWPRLQKTVQAGEGLCRPPFLKWRNVVLVLIIHILILHVFFWQSYQASLSCVFMQVNTFVYVMYYWVYQVLKWEKDIKDSHSNAHILQNKAILSHWSPVS